MRRIFLLILIISAQAVTAFEWSVEQVNLTATFGENRGDHFHTGVDIGGGEQTVRPLAPGELVFSYRRSTDYTSLPVGLGEFCVLQHQGGIRSVYAHLKKNSMPRDRVNFDPEDSIGIIGDTGNSYGRHLHLTIIDTEMNTIINPLLVLPPLKDEQAPIIKNLYLWDGETLQELKEGQTVSPEEKELLVEVFDLREDVSFIWKYAPYKISLYQDGKEISKIAFDSLQERKALIGTSSTGGSDSDGSGGIELVLTNTGSSFSEIYESDWLFRLGSLKLVPGNSSLLIIASDFSGNESSHEIMINVGNLNQ